VPLYRLDPSIRELFDDLVQRLVDSSSDVASAVRRAVKEAWLSEHADKSGDLTLITYSFFEQTENAFYDHLLKLKLALESSQSYQPVFQSWWQVLVRSGDQIFDRFATVGGLQYVNLKRLAAAHQGLRKMLYGKKLKESLSLSVTEEKQKNARAI
jgi:hypothetical protein